MSLTPYKGHIVLLPEDRELIDVLGITEEEYRSFVREAMKRSRIEPGKPQALLLIPFVANLVIGLALSYVGNLLAPKNTGGKGPNIRQTQKQGQNIVSQTEFAPKVGFDSLQNVVELGSSVPVIYAKREVINGFTYGGVRVNTNLVWSQMQSYGGNQLFRAIFLIGEGAIGALDPTQFAFGDNTINGYDLGLGNSSNSRVTFYQKTNGGRITSADRIAGRTADKDPGNAQNQGALDVFHVQSINNEWRPDFCYSYKPATQTQFGVYSPIGVGLGYRINPSMRPAVAVRTVPEGDKGKVKLQCDKDGVALAQRNKYNTKFKSRSGIIRINGVNFNNDDGETRTLNVNDTVTYFLERRSDARREFRGGQPGNDHKETCNDVAQAVASRQKNWDDSCSIGDLYKLGTAQLICESRSPIDEVFSSEVDQDPIGGGQDMAVTFRVVKSGIAELTSLSGVGTGTSRSHLLKLSICAFTLSRATQVIELGFKSTLGIRINGLCNFKDAISHREIDGRACEHYRNRVFGKGQSLGLSNYSSGSFSGSERRYSFFRIGYRVAGSTDAYIYMSQCFGFAGVTQQNQFNYIRLQMPRFEVWEFKIEPLSGWEIRSNQATGSLEVLDAKISQTRTVWSSDVGATFNGRAISRERRTFQMACTRDRNLGVEKQDTRDYADDWGKLAEAFVYDEIQSSARTPEHELAYINIITPNTVTPTYNNLALIGMNIRSSTEFSQLKQLSVYVTSGLGGYHTFPQVLQDLLSNTRYGLGATLSAEQIDNDLLLSATSWTYSRRYFWDGALPEPVNIRQWASTTAPHFLLEFVIKNGKFALQPAVYFNQPEVITNLFTSGNILEDSFEFSYADTEERIPKRVSVKWRHERPANTNDSAGIFPLIREINIREVGTPADAPLETLDLTDFCTNQEHAIDVAKYICRVSRLVTHSVSFKTVPTEAGLEIGRCFKLGLETVNYAQPNNGAISSDGTITSIDPISNGTYDVLLWNGTTNAIQQVQLNVVNGKATNFSNAVFCIKTATVSTVAYKVQSLSFDEEGNLQVEASVFPLKSNDYSLITEGWEVPGNWIIEGEIAGGETDAFEEAFFDGVNILGPSSLTKNVADEYTALISGTVGTYSYQWSSSSPGVTFSAPTAATTQVTVASEGNAQIQVTVVQFLPTGTGNTVTQTKAIEVLGPSTLLDLIGTVGIVGPTTVGTDVPAVYDVVFTGQSAPIASTAIQVGGSYQIVSVGTTDFTLVGSPNNNIGTVFTATGVGAGTGSVSNLDDVFISWNWTSTNLGADVDITESGAPKTGVTFLAGGTYNLNVTISSATAADSPKTATLSVVVDAPVVTVVATDPDANEVTPPAVADGGLFTLTRTGPTTNPLTVTVSLTGTAISGIDYTHSLLTNAPSAGYIVVFAAGSATSLVPITITPDALTEAPETITLEIVSDLGYESGTPSSATIVIREKAGPNQVFAGPSTGIDSAPPSFRQLTTNDLPSIGTAGTYTKVTTDLKGRVISGSNPTTLEGYGITDTYTSEYIDAMVQGLKPKQLVRVATTTNITLSGTQTVDTVTTLATGDRVLVKDQTNKSQNGFYNYNSAGAWTRTADFDEWSEVPNAYVFVREGLVNAGDSFVCISGSNLFGASEIGSSDIEFILFSAALELFVSTGLNKVGNTISLANTSVAANNYGSASQVATFTVDAQGRLTAAANVALGIGTVANKPIITGTGGALVAGSFGTTANTFCEGNDSRLLAAGTVTSVGLSLPTSLFQVTGSPVVSSGDLTATLSPQSPNRVFAGPAAGGLNFAPVFRALVAADLPDSGVVDGNYGSANAVPTVTLDKKGRIVSIVNTPIAISNTAITGLGTASTRNVPASGNAADTEVVLGGDSRLSDARAPLYGNQNPNLVLAGPSTGSTAGTPTFRALVATDIPAHNQDASTINSGTLNALRLPAFTGDATSTSGTSALTLSNSGVVAGTYNSSTEIRPFTVDAKGRLTSVGTAVTIAPAFSSITNKPTTLSGYGITDALSNGNQNPNLVLAGPSTGSTAGPPTFRALVATDIPNIDATKITSGTLNALRLPAFTGDATSTAGTSALTLSNTGVTAGTYNSSTEIRPFTVDAKGRLTSVGTAVTITPAFSSIANKPTTLSGYGITDALSNGNQNPNLVLAGPSTGSTAGTPTFRALVATDLPTHNQDASTITSGTLNALRLPAFTGDATSTAGTSALTLSNSGVTAGTYNSSTSITPFTVDAKGRLTAVGTAVTITPAFSSITNKPTTLSGYGITDALASNSDRLTPSGAITQFAGATPPAGWLKCNGDTIPNGTGTVQGVTANFAPLYAVLQNTYGGFGKLPDLRGEFIRGWDDGRGVDGGRGRGTSQSGQLEQHAHSMNHGHTITDSGHVHGVSDSGHSHGVNDPTHAHGVSDPGHGHNIVVFNNVGTLIGNDTTTTIWQSVASNTPLNNSGITSYVQGTNASQRFLGIGGRTTGISTIAAATSITIVNSGTGISVANNGTGISVNGMTGNTGTAGAAVGADANRPRNIAMLVIIKI